MRVVNGGAPATISLPCGGEILTLEAQSPGSRETLRASVDYDNIGPARGRPLQPGRAAVRAAGSEHIEDQEIFRRVSVEPGTTRFVATALQESTLVRVRGDVPLAPTRPHLPSRMRATRSATSTRTPTATTERRSPITTSSARSSAARVCSRCAARTSSISSACRRSTRERDVGAERARGRVAAVPRPARAPDRRSAGGVGRPATTRLRGLRELALQTEDALMCFPRVLAYDRLRGRYEIFANCGAVAGVLARIEEQRALVAAGPGRGDPAASGHAPGADAERFRAHAARHARHQPAAVAACRESAARCRCARSRGARRPAPTAAG